MTATNIHPADLVTRVIIAFLTPMLLAATGGDQAQARATALQAVNAYAARNPAEMLLIGQSIALGLAVINNISLSMAENIPIPLILRLRANAVSLHRASERCRHALAQPEPRNSAPAYQDPPSDTELPAEQDLLDDCARTRQRITEYQASFAQPAEPAATPEAPPHESPVTDPATATQPTPEATPQQAPMTREQYFATAWSTAMATVADEITAGMADLPPDQREDASVRIAALNRTASGLVSGEPAAAPR